MVKPINPLCSFVDQLHGQGMQLEQPATPFEVTDRTLQMRTDTYTECRGVGHIVVECSAAEHSGQVSQTACSGAVQGNLDVE